MSVLDKLISAIELNLDSYPEQWVKQSILEDKSFFSVIQVLSHKNGIHLHLESGWGGINPSIVPFNIALSKDQKKILKDSVSKWFQHQKDEKKRKYRESVKLTDFKCKEMIESLV